MRHAEPLQLGVCELYNGILHGPCEPHVADHFLYTCQVNLYDFYDNSIFLYLSEYPGTYKYSGNVRAYWNIVNRPNRYPLLEIVQPFIVESTGECVAIIKTFWIRIFQRRWKRIFAERRHRVAQLLKPYGLLRRECGWKL
jgi:hypothetical protein